MSINIFYAWFAGLFEGEGSFGFSKNKAKRLSLVSTDRDVLQRIQDHIGGYINNAWRNNQKKHWKDAYVWYISGKEAIQILENISPYLLQRRSNRGKEWLASYEIILANKNRRHTDAEAMANQMVILADKGLTHQQIADQLGYERSHVSKTIKKRK